MLDNTIAAASVKGARVLLPGTVYKHGPDAFPVIDEAAPENPVKGMAAFARSDRDRRARSLCGPVIFRAACYLPDVAETMMQLIEREETLEPFATFHMEGHCNADGTRTIAAIRQASAGPTYRSAVFRGAGWMVASLFMLLFRKLREMRYLWQVPVRLTNARLIGTLGAPNRKREAAVRATLVDLNCLGPAKAQLRLAEQRR